MIEYWTLYVRPNSESILLSQKSIYGFIHKTLTMKTTDLKYITLKKNEIKILFRETRFRISLKIFLRVKIIS